MNRLVVILGGGVVALGAVSAVYFLAPKPQTSPADTSAPMAKAESRAPVAPKPDVPGAGRPSASNSKASSAAATATPTPEPEAKLGTLIIESDVPETSVFIDRVYLGSAPITARNLTPGSHHLNMSVKGYEGVSESIDVQPGTRTISMKFKEIRLDESVDVTHKHAIGSCSGTLRANPQRLSYETTNAGDAFAIALTNLEVFEVDYLQKNLKVKIKDGKTYNFADPAGNADRLYRFHQTVEKVRQRLLSGRRP
jgi:hypothetical protein